MTRISTRAEDTYQSLRADILTGRLLPGDRLLFNELIARYSTSVGVLREALSRLAEQRLVISQPQQGYRVVPIDPQDLRDLTEARVQIETLAFRSAMTFGDLTWESHLVAAHHILEGTPELSAANPHEVNEDWAVAHTVFHRTLLEACPNRRIREFAGSLRDASEVYRRWSRHLGREDTRDIPGEHRALMTVALARDIDRGTELLARHIEFTTNAVLAAGPAAPADPPADAAPPPDTTASRRRRQPSTAE